LPACTQRGCCCAGGEPHRHAEQLDEGKQGEDGPAVGIRVRNGGRLNGSGRGHVRFRVRCHNDFRYLKELEWSLLFHHDRNQPSGLEAVMKEYRPSSAPEFDMAEGVALALSYLEDPPDVPCPRCGDGTIEVVCYPDARSM